MPDQDPSSMEQLHDDLHTEYGKLVDIVSGFDQRLLTIKGWGVTVSLAGLGLGFQQGHYGLFLVAAVSGAAFWLLEAYAKMHQIHYYPRMRDIEVTAYELFRVDTASGAASSPLIDWGWETAGQRIRKQKAKGTPNEPVRYAEMREERSVQPWTMAHVMFPHVVSIVVGTILFILGLGGAFGQI
ncbi:hypothetical protein [Mycolicibacterium baixiangningiae]|uniref:hypothetical protein n=1 Tax=Mycolicibacterium baixiangningiae TaxID=2761578 RepID=UPI001867FDF4|nr:hypothetical protein [Mycolicibacterium baixiangningiae]